MGRRSIGITNGGPLALYRLGQFTRIQVLKDNPPPRKVLPIPTNMIYQQGNLEKWTKFLELLNTFVTLCFFRLCFGGPGRVRTGDLFHAI
jgi:hypothetical protein